MSRDDPLIRTQSWCRNKTTYVGIFVYDEVDNDGRAFLECIDGVEKEERVAHVSLAGQLAGVPVYQMKMNLVKQRIVL